MMRLRPYRNDDPPALAEIWRSQPSARRLFQPMTAVMFDELVLCKPYFDRLGLIVAELGGKAVGFAHAAFGCSEDGTSLNHRNPLRGIKLKDLVQTIQCNDDPVSNRQ